MSDAQILKFRQGLFSGSGVYKGVVNLIHQFKPTRSCIEEVSSLKGRFIVVCSVLMCAEIKGLEMLDLIISECVVWFQSFKTQPNHNPFGLSEDEIMALAFYTFDLCFNAASREANFYFQLNKMLQKRNFEEITKWKGYLFFLQSALSKFPPQELKTFRGIPDKQIFQENYTKGRRIHSSSFSSSTTNKAKAIEFSQPGGIVLCIDIFNGRSIKDYSVIPEEEEILLSPNMAFTVTRSMYHEDGVDYVDLLQDRPEPTFVF